MIDMAVTAPICQRFLHASKNQTNGRSDFFLAGNILRRIPRRFIMSMHVVIVRFLQVKAIGPLGVD